MGPYPIGCGAMWRSGAIGAGDGDNIPPVLSIYPSSTEDTHLSPSLTLKIHEIAYHTGISIRTVQHPSALATGRLHYVSPPPQ